MPRDVGVLLLVAAADPRRHVQRLADREQPDGDDHDVDAREQLVDAERQPRLAGQLVDPDQPDREAEASDSSPRMIERPISDVTATNASTTSAK